MGFECTLSFHCLSLMSSPSWSHFIANYHTFPNIGFSIDVSRMGFSDSFFESMAEPIAAAEESMRKLESGAISNPDENRMVGHYWLRKSSLAPTEELRSEIESTLASTLQFAADVHSGKVAPPNGGKFTRVLVVGIGGSALGPQLVAGSIAPVSPPLAIHFFDNTDPDGMERILAEIGADLRTTLTLVISKSGGTKETRNGMLEAESAYQRLGLHFPSHAVAVTGVDSKLDQHAVAHGWLARFPMWDWVGGRTSVMSAVGTLAAALQAVDVPQFLAGAAAMDEITRSTSGRQNPAMLLALMWHHAGGGRGLKDMVVLPYKDRLVLFSKYLQQLVMESLGKEHDLDGKTVNQGIAVYGNKGSTDQHAYVQQLRDGVNNFFATFIEVRQATEGDSIQVEPGFTSGDFLQGFLRGTREALTENDRESITLSIAKIDAFNLGILIGLFERAVGFYASLVNINAYHQPGVEAGKVAAGLFLERLALVRNALPTQETSAADAVQIADHLGIDPEGVFHILNHLVAKGEAKAIANADSPKASFMRC